MFLLRKLLILILLNFVFKQLFVMIVIFRVVVKSALVWFAIEIVVECVDMLFGVTVDLDLVVSSFNTSNTSGF
jgi:hypothetical protein